MADTNANKHFLMKYTYICMYMCAVKYWWLLPYLALRQSCTLTRSAWQRLMAKRWTQMQAPPPPTLMFGSSIGIFYIKISKVQFRLTEFIPFDTNSI